MPWRARPASAGRRPSDADRQMPDVVDLQEVDDLALDLVPQRQLLAPRPAPVCHRRHDAGAHGVMAAKLDVLEHRQALKQGDVLERARQAERGACVDGRAVIMRPPSRISPRAGR